MAFVKLMIVVGLAAVVQAGSAWTTTWPRQPMHFAPFAPFLPFPPFPPSAIHVPSPAEIAQYQPPPGSNYQATSMQSSSKLEYDQNGNVIRKGGTTITINDNGNAQTFTVGNNPPNLNRVIIPPIPDFEIPEMPDFTPFPDFPKFDFPEIPKPKPFKIKPLKISQPEDILLHIPKENEKYHGFHQSSFSESSNVNGKTFSRGGSDVGVNDNGHLDEDTVRFQAGDPELVKKAKRAHEDFTFKPHHFPTMKPFPRPKRINLDDIRHHVPKNNEKFFGAHHSSNSQTVTVNGKTFSQGGSDTAVNDNGHLDEDNVRFREGDPELVRKSHHDRFKFKPHHFPTIKPIVIRPPKKIDLDKLKTHIPGPNEKFVGFSTSSFTKSTNNNGHKTLTGGSETVLNENGKVDEDKVKFHQEDKPKDEVEPKKKKQSEEDEAIVEAED